MKFNNPFKGNLDVIVLKQLLESKEYNIPMVILTITNNTIAGQPVSLNNIKEVYKICKEHDVILFFDACRFAENAYFIKTYEREYKDLSIKEIIKEMFIYCDGFTISLKKDGHSNIGGFLCFRDKGIFRDKYKTDKFDIGTRIKEKQIITFGNDSYGGLSGRDIMGIIQGIYECTKYE